MKSKRYVQYGGVWCENTGYFERRTDNRLAVLGLRQPEKTKWSHPYSYDPFIVWFGNAKRGDHAVYSDRLWQWDYSKCEASINSVRAKDEHHRFSNDDPKQVEEFLGLYYGKKITLTAIVEGCNASAGYPYWVFYYREE